MEEKMFKSFLQEYIEIHNELIDAVEVERLEKQVKGDNEKLQAMYARIALVANGRNAPTKDVKFKDSVDELIENKEKITRSVENNKKKIEELKKNIGKEATVEKLRQEQKMARKEAEDQKKRLLSEEVNSYKDELAYLEDRELVVEGELEKFKNRSLDEASFEDLKKVKDLKGELAEIREDKGKVEQQIFNGSKKIQIEREYKSFIELLDMADRSKDKVSMRELVEEKEREEQIYKDSIGELEPIEPSQQTQGQGQPDPNQQGQGQPDPNQQGQGQPDPNQQGQGQPDPNQQGQGQPVKIENMYISEQSGVVYVTTSDRKIERACWMDEAKKAKKENYKELKIKEMCERIAGGRKEGFLLRTKVNPNIVHALKKYNNIDEIEKYITCLYNKKEELPFELGHDLKKSQSNFIGRIVARRQAKAENEIPGTKITFENKKRRFWNRNKAIEPAKQEAMPRIDSLEQYRAVIDQKEQAKFAQAMNQAQAQLGEDVQKAMSQEENQSGQTR